MYNVTLEVPNIAFMRFSHGNKLNLNILTANIKTVHIVREILQTTTVMKCIESYV